MFQIALRFLNNIEVRLSQIFLGRFLPAELCAVSSGGPQVALPDKDDGFLWAVPKSRRTVEKRRMRKYGWPDHVWKPLVPKRNLIPCTKCGNFHEGGYLCPTCYKRVMDETMEMQDKIQEELRLDPVDKEVAVIYQGEQGDASNQFYKGKRIVEMDKERPPWFSRNLLQRSADPSEPAPDLKPKDLA